MLNLTRLHLGIAHESQFQGLGISKICAETDVLAAMKVRACDGPSACAAWPARGGPVQVGVGVSIIRAGEKGTSTPGAHTAAPRFQSRSHGETKKAAHRFSAIKMRSVNGPRQGSSAPVQPLNP